MNDWLHHLTIAPIVLPLIAGAVILFFDERNRTAKATVNLLSTLGLGAIAITLFMLVLRSESENPVTVYLLGNWAAPFGIVLVLDRLSALMLVVTSVLSMASVIYAMVRWHKAGVHFHALFQFLLMGLNGIFLTGDLFNLFVFFEVMLAASYGLALHGSGIARIRASMNYVTINLVASFLFLIGVSLIYGVTGTLNMADLADRIPQVADENRMLLEAGAAVLGIAFLVKAGMWPLNFWLVPTYIAAVPPVAAIFAIMSKVGVYVVLRLSLLLFGGDGAGSSQGLGNELLFYGGLITILFGMSGVLAAQHTGRIAAFTILVSSGTLLAAIGTGNTEVTAGALFYLITSTFAVGAFFLLIELVERGREFGADMLAVTREAFGEADEEGVEEEEEEVGIPVPATMAIIGISFLSCTVLFAGLPPLAGFIAKFAILSALLGPDATITAPIWVFIALLIVSGFAALTSMGRAGISALWGSEDRDVPRISVLEISPVVGLLIICLVMTVQAGPVMSYMEATARTLHAPTSYVTDVLNAPRVMPDATTEGGSK